METDSKHIHGQNRWISSFKSRRHPTHPKMNLDLRNSVFLGSRFESTATEKVEASNPPAEEFAYQAEVSIIKWFHTSLHY